MWNEISERCRRTMAAGLEMITLPVDQILALEDELRGRWIPVTERLPACDSSWVLVQVDKTGYQRRNTTMAYYDYNRDGWRDRWGAPFYGEVTHWRPIPE